MTSSFGRATTPLTRAILCALAPIAFTSTAWAQTPDQPLVQTEEPGTIVTHLLIPASEEQVRAVLDDPHTFGSFTPDVQRMTVHPRGRCKLLRFDTRGLLEPLQYSTLRCPSGSGWSETLLESDSFTRYDADIQLLPVVGGTHVIYRLSVGIDLPVPDMLIDKNVKRSARLTMQAVRDLFTRSSAASDAQDSPPAEPADQP